MTEELVDNFLEHYGVRGMRWGVRKDNQGHVTSVVTKDRKSVDQRAVALSQVDDPELRRNIKRSLDKLPSIYKEAKKNIDAGLIAINKSHKYKDADLTDPDNALTKDYHKEVSKMVTRQLDIAGVLKTNTKDTFVLAFDYDSSVGGNPKAVSIGGVTNLATSRYARQKARAEQRAVRAEASIYTQPERQAARVKVVRNFVLATALVRAANLTWNSLAQSDDNGFQISPEFDEKGLIMTISFPDIENDVSHSAAIDFLEHYGVKGMRWGVRRSNPSGGSAKTAVKKLATKPAVKTAPKPAAKTEVKTVEKPKAEAEAPHGPKKASEMSTEELQKIIQRINLEKQYNDLVFKPMTNTQRTNSEKAKAFAGKVLKKAGEKAVQKVADKAADKLIESVIGKAASKVVAKKP